MFPMMMAHMNAAAAAAVAAMGIGTTDPNSAAALANSNRSQSFYPNSINYSPTPLIPGDDASRFRNLLELHSNQSQQQQSHQAFSQAQFNDYQPQVDTLSHFAQTITHTGQQQHQTTNGKAGKEFSRDGPRSENEDSNSQSVAFVQETGSGHRSREKRVMADKFGVKQSMKCGRKICRVCGDKALGYNFNVVSCESCKAFFRRNALKDKEFRCPFSDSCEITAISRRFCQKCRLRKCFAVGMKKEWIMSEEARLQKRARMEENRRKRGSTPDRDRNSDDDNQSCDALASGLPSKKPGLDIDSPKYPNRSTDVNSSPQTPAGFGSGGPFSPPASHSSSKSSLSPSSSQQRRFSELDQSETVSATSQKLTTSLNALYEQEDLCPETPPAILAGDQESNRNFDDGISMVSPGSACPNLASVGSVITDTQTDHAHLQYSLVPGFGIGAQKLGFPFGNVGLGGSLSAQDLDSISIPKSVLISLINQCHATPSAKDFVRTDPPPIVARAQRLVADGYSDCDLACICRCACGARSANARIGIRTVDKGVGPDDAEEPKETKQPKRKFSTRSMVGVCSIKPPTDDWIKGMTFGDAAKTEESDRSMNEFTWVESFRLKELYSADKVMTDPLDMQEEKNWQQLQKLQEAAALAHNSSARLTNTIHLTDICVRRIIKMCKKISAFVNLCHDDQIALLKGGCMELILMRGVMTFIPEKESWRPVGCKDTLLSLEVLKGVKGNVYEEHRRFLNSFREEWRRSDAIMLTLSAITLFNPKRPNITYVQAVEMERDTYTEILKRYLDKMYGTDSLASLEAYRELLLRVQDVKRLNDYAATIFLEVHPSDVEPLLIEIFDMT